MITFSVLRVFRGGFLEHPKQVLIELYSKVDGGEPKCRIGKNGILGFLASSVLKGGGTEISREISVPRRIFPPIKTAFSPDDFKLSLLPSLLPFSSGHLLYQHSMTNNQSVMCSKVA